MSALLTLTLGGPHARPAIPVLHRCIKARSTLRDRVYRAAPPWSLPEDVGLVSAGSTPDAYVVAPATDLFEAIRRRYPCCSPSSARRAP